MALAYLCSRARKLHMRMKLADNPVSNYHCSIVDHRLRPSSDKEARAVADVLEQRLSLRCHNLTLAWGNVLKASGHAHPKDLSNFETLARRLRYRAIGHLCAQQNVASLFLAHHEDDQYETVLMRLLSGHGAAGVLGMRPATDIPECHDLHGAYQSGFVDDQHSDRPMINYRPTRNDRRRIRAEMVEEMDADLVARELAEGVRADVYIEDEFDAHVPRARWMLPAAPPEVEDGGVMVYRPLLGFGKDRLVATCEANGVPWFEDATNHDPTLTLRNAVRHLHKNHTLPVALQKPAVLDMSRRLRRQAAMDVSEAERLLRRTIVRDFDSTSGTIVVHLPSFRVPRLRKGPNRELRRASRLDHYRNVAALLLRKLIAIVTPQLHGALTSNLQNTIIQLFPSLNDNLSDYPQDPKPFNVSGVHFTPIRSPSHPTGPLKWYLSREPYVSDRPTPQCDFGCLPLRLRWRRRPEQWRWPSLRRWELWDGRFWVNIRNRSPLHAAFAPFDPRHAKAFRDSLPAGSRGRDELVALLKRHAPGKVRYTLPALYASGDLAQAVRDYEGFVDRERAEMLGEAEVRGMWKSLNRGGRKAYLTAKEWERERGMSIPWEKGDWADDDKRVLVALPTLGIARPGLHNWMRYEIRYKRVDRRVLQGSAKDEKELGVYESMRRRARVRGARRWGERCAVRRRQPVVKHRARAKKGPEISREC